MSLQRPQYVLDSSVRRFDQGTALLGGSPTQLTRLSAQGASTLDRVLGGLSDEPLPPNHQALVERLIRAGQLHRVVVAVDPHTARGAQVGFVIPVLNDAPGVQALVERIRREWVDHCIVVVDDGSGDRCGRQLAAIAARYGALLVRHPTPGGPAAARNAGMRRLLEHATNIEVVVFADADVVPELGAIAAVVARVQCGAVAAAPRIQAEVGHSALARYEAASSPLDMGIAQSRVRAGSRVSHVPAALVAMSAQAVSDLGGFDEAFRFGEDVDLIWRLDQAGGSVIYDPTVSAHHRSRPTLGSMIRQRFGYGTSAGALANRHPNNLAPVRVSLTTAAATVAIGFGRRRGLVSGAALLGLDFLQVRSRLIAAVDLGDDQSWRLWLHGQRNTAKWLTRSTTRVWMPLSLAALASPRLRRSVIGAALVGPVVDWFVARPRLDPLRYVVLRLVDDGAYGAGVIVGAVQARNLEPLLPRPATQSGVERPRRT